MLKPISAAILVFLTACAEQKPAMPQQQIAFCEIVRTYRELYATESKKDFYIDKEKTLTNIFAERTAQLIKVLGEGNIEGWRGSINAILVSKSKGAFLEVALPCGAVLKPQENLIIKVDTPLYESLRHFHEKSEITFSGSLLISPSKAPGDYPYKVYYGEKSFTESGSMREPEFLFMFKEIR